MAPPTSLLLILGCCYSLNIGIVRAVSYDQDGRIELHIGGIFPMTASVTGWAGAQACLPAALMALDDINDREDVLPGYKLVLHGHKNDSGCKPGLAARIMYELIYNEPKKLVLLSGCSSETTMVGEAAQMWNLLVMGYGSSSPALSDKARFPTLYRTHPSGIIHNPARLAMFEKYDWRRIGVIHSNDEVFSTTADDLEEQLSQSGSIIVARQNFGDPVDAVTNLKRQDARIIVGMFYEPHARQVLCEVYKKELYGPRYVWFLIGWYKDEWYLPQADEPPLDCTPEQMKQAAQFHFTTEGLMQSNDKIPGISNMTFEMFQKKLMHNLSDSFNTTAGTQEAPLAYDAIWAVALAFNCTIRKLEESGSQNRLEYFTYTDNETYRILDWCMKQVDFLGVSGEVKFSLSGDRITLTQIEQLQGNSYEVVGNYDDQKKEILWTEGVNVIFPGGKPPQDQTLVREKWISVSVDVYGSMTFFAGVGIAVAIACIGFNYGFCYRKLIYLSQYQVNNLMLAGCIVCFVAIFITGLPMQTSPDHRDTFSVLCHARVTLLMYGFTLVYGALFSKVWIVHRMGSVDTRNETMGRFSTRALKKLSTYSYSSSAGFQDRGSVNGLAVVSRSAAAALSALDKAVAAWKFYAVVGVLAAIDTVIALLWVVVDPLQRSEEDVQDTDSTPQNKSSVEDIKIDSKLEHCTSKYLTVWTGLVYAYKGLLLLFGLFLAYEIRNAKAKHVNDSRFVSMAIYNVAVLCLITGPVTLIIQSQPDANFGFISCTILLCTFISMGLIFVPKVMHIVRVPSTAETHKASSGGGCSGSITESTLTKEEQDRLKKLVQENEDIQRQIAEKDVRIMELRRRLEYRMAQHGALPNNNAARPGSSSERESSIVTQHQQQQPKLSIGGGSPQQQQLLPNGQVNKTLALPSTTILSSSTTAGEGVQVAVTKRSASVAPMPQPAAASTAITTQIHPQRAVTFGGGPTVASVPTEPSGARDVDDSGYKSSTNGAGGGAMGGGGGALGKNVADAIEPADTDVLL